VPRGDEAQGSERDLLTEHARNYGMSGPRVIGRGGWKHSEQARPMREACDRAKITPPISFHILRHTWASHAVMIGASCRLVAKNLGHRTLVEKLYGHFGRDFITDAIRASAPRYGIKPRKRVVPLR
jgi:integrase